MSWSAFKRQKSSWNAYQPGLQTPGPFQSSRLSEQQLETFAERVRGQAPVVRSRAVVLPKDGSLRAAKLQFYLFQELTDSAAFAEGLYQIGRAEGFRLQLLALADEFQHWRHWCGEKGVELVSLPDGFPWLEDMVETLSGGNWLIPPEFPDDELGTQAVAVVDVDRRRRFGRHRLADLSEVFAGQGMCNARQLQMPGLALALAAGGQARIARSYLEGGNLLSGRRPNGEIFALIGRDSLALSRSVLEFHSERVWTPEQVARLLAAELGLARRQLIAVEQPGVYHLDLRMACIGPGHIALQESRGEWCSPLEDLAAADLERAGLKVTRLVGAWPNPDNHARDRVNFFNARHLGSPDGWFGIYTGGSPEQQSSYLEALLQAGSLLERAYFFAPELGQGTLEWLGGLKCRTKVLER